MDLQLNLPDIQIQQKLQLAWIFPSVRFVVAKDAGASWTLNLSYAADVLGQHTESTGKRSFLKAVIAACQLCSLYVKYCDWSQSIS